MSAKYQPPKTSQGLVHNSSRWSLATNRHRTTSGNYWGWIEGHGMTWNDDLSSSNETSLTGDDAAAAIKEHNEWLEAQKSDEVRLLELHARAAPLRRRISEADQSLLKMRDELTDIESLMHAIQVKGQ